ncbi:MAG: CBS domain-containing protein [Nitrospira sp.]|nr:CBS domain-containing protein [bacterium]MBL7031728.1 CBS domain-containing protein [Nitrospira sp.]
MLTAKDIMTEEVITVKSEASVEELARLLIEHKISGVPVVNESNHIVGIVTENDLIKKNKRFHIPTIIRLFDAYFLLDSDKVEDDIKKMVAGTVGEICTNDVVSITADTTIEDIATIMAEQHIHLLPVLNGLNVVGIVGKADVVKSMTDGFSK